MLIVLALLPIGGTLLSYQYTRAHGWVNVHLFDQSLGPNGDFVERVTLVFRDAGGEPLAEARSVRPPGVIHYAPPGEPACTASFEDNPTADRNVWKACFEQTSRWHMEWAPRVASADLRFGDCVIANQPVTFQREDGKWWRWWILLPHHGGFESTTFHTGFLVDGATCRVLRVD